MDKGGGGGGAAARKALQQGGRFLSDLFKGGPTVPLPLAGQHGLQLHGGDEEDGGDALGSSERAQSHSAALERFLGHVNAAMAASAAAREAAAKRRPAHQKTLSSSSASIVSCSSTSASSDGDAQQAEEQAGQDDDDDDDNEDTTGEEAEAGGVAELRPTFRSVPMGVLQQHADASLAVVDGIAAYVDDRWRLEAKYARERGRLKLQLLQLQLQEGRAANASAIAGGGGSGGRGQYDALDALAEALALFQEVGATQIGATVEEIDQVSLVELV